MRMVTVDSRNPFELLASYPARSRFPRAFLFDEGFHLLLICKWSDSLCANIFSSWFESQSEQIFGQITHEQARGDESRQNIPPENQSIRPESLKLPTIFMPLNLMFEMSEHSPKIANLLIDLHPRVLDLFDFYQSSLENQAYPCTFGFRARTSTLLEQSALDDYPRGVSVHDRGEIHLDLQS